MKYRISKIKDKEKATSMNTFGEKKTCLNLKSLVTFFIWDSIYKNYFYFEKKVNEYWNLP